VRCAAILYVLRCQFAVRMQKRAIHLKLLDHSSFWATTSVWRQENVCCRWCCGPLQDGLGLVRAYILADSMPTPMAQNTLLPNVPKSASAKPHMSSKQPPNSQASHLSASTYLPIITVVGHMCVKYIRDPKCEDQDLHARCMMKITADQCFYNGTTALCARLERHMLSCSTRSPPRLALQRRRHSSMGSTSTAVCPSQPIRYDCKHFYSRLHTSAAHIARREVCLHTTVQPHFVA
jgi:hypothetical protein